MVLAHADIFTGIVDGTPLADNNIACLGKLPAVKFYSEAFAF